MAVVRRLGLFRRKIIETIDPAALEALFGLAQVISEGQVAEDGCYFGSTIVTIDLSRAHTLVRDDCDVATAATLARCMATDSVVRQRCTEVAVREAERLVGCRLQSPAADLRVRVEGRTVHVDVDLEAEAVAASPAAGGAT